MMKENCVICKDKGSALFNDGMTLCIDCTRDAYYPSPIDSILLSLECKIYEFLYNFRLIRK